MDKQERIRVLIADDDNQLSRRLAGYISEKGFLVKVVANGKDARKQILLWKPRFVLADLMLPDGGALTLIDFIKNESSLRHNFMHVLVMSGHNLQANVRQSMAQGAKDYLVKPFRPEDVVKRLIFHSRAYRHLKEISAKEFNKVDEASLMLHLTDLVMRQALGGGTLADILFNLTRMVSMRVDGVRCSVINVMDQHLGYVVTSNDDRGASGIQLDNAELRNVQEVVKDISFNSIIVCPISRLGKPFGVLSLRMPPEKQTISDNEIRFVEIVSHVISLVLGNEMRKDNADFWIKEGAASAPVVPLRTVKNS